MSKNTSITRLGVIGGGQLARMLAITCKKYDVSLTVLDPDCESPAGQIAHSQIQGSVQDGEALRQLCETSDVVTFDLENVGADILMTLADSDVRIVPSPEVIHLVQNKLHQKQHYKNYRLPTAHFEPIISSVVFESVQAFGLPCVQKANTGGYDGRGIHFIRSRDDWENRLMTASFVEEFIGGGLELSVMVACTANGNCVAYDPVEMVVDPKLRMLDYLLAPARIDQATANAARHLAVKTVESFGSPGLFGVELFCTLDGDLFINEVAPRAHNSGHHTIEASVTSQFENQLRVCLNLPLGDTSLHSKALTVNLIGEPGFYGKPVIEGIEAIESFADAHIHLYQKNDCRPGRKMGHVTFLASDYQNLIEQAEKLKSTLTIRGELEL